MGRTEAKLGLPGQTSLLCSAAHCGALWEEFLAPHLHGTQVESAFQEWLLLGFRTEGSTQWFAPQLPRAA